MKHKNLLEILLWALVLMLPRTVLAALTVASPFTDNAVLQQELVVPVWGTADTGSEVTVEFAGQKKTAVADSKGKWKAVLEPLPAMFEPHTMTVSSPEEPSIELKNILVGEVWICSGQSNMQMGYGAIPELKALARRAKNIRAFEVKRTVAFEEQDSLAGEWLEGSPSSAVALSFAYHLQNTADVPVGIILTCWGSSSIEAWMPRDMTETVPHFKTMMEEFDADMETRDKITAILEGPKPWSGKDDVFLRRQSNILYNAIMHPLAPYACRGLVWYQGERNTQSMHGMLKDPWFSRNSGMIKYGDTLTKWIERYRQEWGNAEMHFIITMLPGYYKEMNSGPKLGPEHPASHSWGWMRESQLKALQLPHTSVANTVDLGDVKNVHPKDKLPVGQRIAQLAAHDALGKDIPALGPMMNRVDLKRNTLVVHFDHAVGLMTTDGEAPSGFWLADDSAQWVKAEALLDGATVVLSSPEVSKPLYVRYAFAGKPKVNLVNAAGLPAYPFRTDSFQP